MMRTRRTALGLFLAVGTLLPPSRLRAAVVAIPGQGAAAPIVVPSLTAPEQQGGVSAPDLGITQPPIPQEASPRSAQADQFIDDFLRHTRDLSMRDGHQSLDGNRWIISERAPIAALLNKLGFHSMESGGGADFDVATLIGENPFDNQRRFNEALPDTEQQWLFRGRNALGLGPQPADVIAATVEHAAANGLDRIRVFDGMNDVDNVRSTVKAALESGAKVEGAIAYTVDPEGTPDGEKVWTTGAFVEMAKTMKDMGVHFIAIKDMAGVLTEAAVAELVTRLHQDVGLPVSVHSHSSTGRATGVLLKALETARDIGARIVIDTALGDLSGGTSHPDVREILKAELQRAGFAPEDYRDNAKLRFLDEAAALIAKTADKYKPTRITVDAEMSALLDAAGIPGGMVGTTAKLIKPYLEEFRRDTKRPDLTVAEILKEGLRRVPEVRRLAGLPPLVTPMSQFVLMQAIFNFQKGYFVKIYPQFAAMMKGRFGRVRGRQNQALLERFLKEDMLRELADQAASKKIPRSLVNGLDGLQGLSLDEVREKIEGALRGKVPEQALEDILYAGRVGPSKPLEPGMEKLTAYARTLAFKHHLDVPDPREAALLLTARNGEAVLTNDTSRFERRADGSPAPYRGPKAWNKIVGTRPDGFPIVESLAGARTRREIELETGHLARAIARVRLTHVYSSKEMIDALHEEALARLDRMGLKGRARAAGALILDELIENELKTPSGFPRSR